MSAIMTADLSALIARLEAAEVGSEELSARAMQVLIVPNGRVEQSRINGAWCIYVGDRLWQDRGWWRPDGWPVTTSLDAAHVLAERVLEGWAWQVDRWGVMSRITLNECDHEGWHRSKHRRVEVAIERPPALALCIAILRAKQGEG